MDKGWAYNLAGRRWELLGLHGDMIRSVTDEMLTRGLLPEVNLRGAQAGDPELVPGQPWWHLVLRRGREDGRHVYLPPGEVEEPPETLMCSAEPVVVFAAAVPRPPGVSPAEVARSAGAELYRRQIQACGHGRACAYPYDLDRGLW